MQPGRTASKGRRKEIHATSSEARLILADVVDLRTSIKMPGLRGRGAIAGSKDVKVTLVYQHTLRGIPGKSVKGGLGRVRTRYSQPRSKVRPLPVALSARGRDLAPG